MYIYVYTCMYVSTTWLGVGIVCVNNNRLMSIVPKKTCQPLISTEKKQNKQKYYKKKLQTKKVSQINEVLQSCIMSKTAYSK